MTSDFVLANAGNGGAYVYDPPRVAATVGRFAQAMAAFAPSDAANTTPASSASPTLTPLLHAAASAGSIR